MNTENIKIDNTWLILSANGAILGEVRPNIRQIRVNYDQNSKTITLYIYYNESLTQDEEDYDISGTILGEMISDFPDPTLLTWEDINIILPYPDRIPNKGICIYRRYEPNPS
ncbi:hypothetical protein N9Y92_01545 [Chlamydiales bacterium]|nr:hypothetical protein [Chlamydiales bacterium]